MSSAVIDLFCISLFYCIFISFRSYVDKTSKNLLNMPKTIRSGAREIIFKVYQRCLLEHEAGHILSNLDDVYARTAVMTGKSESTVRRIVAEGYKNDGKFGTPGKDRSGRPKKEMDDFNICALRQKIQFFYDESD